MKLQIVTCEGKIPKEDYYTHREFHLSLANQPVEIIILGRAPGEFKGLGSKAKLLQRAIKAGRISAEYIIFTDCFDVVFAARPEEVLDGFMTIRGPHEILWNAERNCFPVAELAERHPPSETSFRYMNSGWGIGSTHVFAQALEEMDPEKSIVDDHKEPSGRWVHSCDQTAWMKQMLFGHTPIGLDTGCILAQALHDVKPGEMDLSGPKIQNIETGSFPMVFHFNGGAKTAGLRIPILRKLGLI